MKKKDQQLDFNFDDVPFHSTVDRTVAKPTQKPQAEPAPASSGYRWGNASAPGSMLTADEIMHLNDKVEETAPAPKPEAVKEEPAGFSSAAMELMRRMQKNEIGYRKSVPEPVSPTEPEDSGASFEIEMSRPKSASGLSFSGNVEVDKRVSDGEGKSVPDLIFGEPKETEDELPVIPEPVISAEPETDFEPISEPVIESVKQPEAVTEVTVDDDDSDVPLMPVTVVNDVTPIHAVSEEQTQTYRAAKAESFELDRTAMDEAMKSETDSDIPEDATTTFDPVSAPAVSVPADSATRMFDAAADGAFIAKAAGSAVKIPDEFGFDDGNDFDRESDENEDTVFDEYRSVEDAQSITANLTARKHKLSRRLFGTGAVAVMLLAITLFNNLFPFGGTPYFVAVGVLLLLAVLFNLSSFSSLISVFTAKPDVDFIPAFAILTSVVQTAVCAYAGVGKMLPTGMFAAAAAVSLTFNTLGKRLTVGRVLANFELIANEESKQAGAFIAPPASESVADPKKLGETLIFGRRTVIDLKDFISYSLSPDMYEKQSGRLSLAVLLISLASLVITMVAKHTAVAAVCALAAAACAASQIAAVYPSAILLSRICRRLRENRVVLPGCRSMHEISEANVIALDSDEIFHDESVKLYKFRAFGDMAIDDAFMTAAALTTEGHSPLAGMFNQISATAGGGVYKADSIIYENAMGLTGWVNERKTLLGNRMIMESHSIAVPSMEVDRKILKNGKFPLYLAIDNKIAAMFIIGYEADKQMLYRLRKLVNTGVNILVRTVDPNVTAELICECYGLPSDSVYIMSADATRIYSNKMCPADNAEAVLVAPSAEGFVDAYISSYETERKSNASSVAVIIMILLMAVLAGLLPFSGFAESVNVLTVLGSYLFTLIISSVAGLLYS